MPGTDSITPATTEPPRGADAKLAADGAGAPDAAHASTITKRDAWTNYLYLASWAYVLYGLGNATPYLRSELKLTDFQAGLHGSALAIGVLAAGISVDAFVRRFGSRWLLDLAVIALTLGVTLIAVAPMLGVSLAGAVFLGLAGGSLGTQVNVNLSRGDVASSRRLISQANALSMVTAGIAPVVMSITVQTLGLWRVAMFVPIVAVIALSLLRTGRPENRPTVRLPRGRLPGAYWFVWLFLALVVSIEFSFVFWGSTIVARQTGIANADATLLASLFVLGMFVGRASLGRGLGAGTNPRLLLTCGLAIAMAGSALVWISHVPAISGVGLFLGGSGTAGLFPIGMAMALDLGGRAKFEAAARGTLASGVAVLLAPSMLGLASDAVGVSTAWPIILLLAVAALGVMAVTPRGEAPAGA